MPEQNLVGSDHRSLKNNHIHLTIFSEFPLSYQGGGERLIRMIYDYIMKTNIDVTIIENSKPNLTNLKTENDSAININKVVFKRYGLFKFIYQDFPPLETIFERRNSVSLLFLRRIPPRKILRDLNAANVNIIFCLHGIAIEKFRITNPLIMVHQILMRIKLRDLARHTRASLYVQSLTPIISSYLINLGANPKNIFTIENKFESDVKIPIRNDAEFQVTFIGRFEDLQKGIKRLKKVTRFVTKVNSKIRFNIIGSGNDIGLLKGLDQNVKIFNRIDDLTKNEIIAHSNLALVTSNLEPFSIVVLEFLTSGVPVITTPASGPSYILSKDSSFGDFVSFSAKSLASSIIKYYNLWEMDKDSYFSRKEYICSKAREMFHSDDMLESYLEMIINVSKKKQISNSDR